MLMAALILMQSGMAFASGSVPDGLNVVQQKIVSGVVTDSDGNALPSVSIQEKGTANGALSDASGGYRITLTTINPVLVFSFVGCVPQETAVDTRSVVNVTMVLSETGLEEIVVVGYGTQRKESVTGSVASMRGETMRDVPSSNITQALQGRIAGVEMQQTSSKPGATMQIRIRGTRSLNASNDPLIVLDGIPFPGSIADIDPSDIKSLDILKDASATAIYGSRGANGVLLITTNKGQKGQKAKFTYNGYYGMKKVFAPYPMMDGPEFVKLRTDAGVYSTKRA